MLGSMVMLVSLVKLNYHLDGVLAEKENIGM
jgi:hypothetical protein